MEYYKFVYYILIFIHCIVHLVSGEIQQTFMFETMNHFGLGNRIIPDYRRIRFDPKAYPAPLPSTPRSPAALVHSPYANIYQGIRRKEDRRVYNEKFDYPAKPIGHHVNYRAMLDCKISHLSVETEQGIPILMRGGVGYRHFMVVARAEPGHALSGRVRAYCNDAVAHKF